MYRFTNPWFPVTCMVLVILCAGSLTAQANLIQNGSFESPSIAASQWITGSEVSNWTVTNYAMLWVDDSDWAAAQEGHQYLAMHTGAAPNQTSVIQQTFTTENGKTYDGSFYYSFLRATAPPYPAGFVTYDIGGTATTVSFAPGTPWTQETFQFTATGTTTTLEFSGVASSGTGLPGPGVDNVVVTAHIPEPGTIVLLLSAAAGLLAYAWRKRR